MENLIPFEIITDRQSGKKRGFGFVPFDDHDAVVKLYCGNTIPSVLRSKKVFVQTRNAGNQKF